MRFNRIVLFTILSAFVLVLVACQGSVYSRMSGKTGLAYASMESCTDIDNTYKSGQWNPESYLLGTYVEQGGILYMNNTAMVYDGNRLFNALPVMRAKPTPAPQRMRRLVSKLCPRISSLL